MSVRKIAMTLNINRRTIAKYLDSDYSNQLISPNKAKKIKSELDDYKKVIYEMLSNNATQKNIYLKIKQLGYKSSQKGCRRFE